MHCIWLTMLCHFHSPCLVGGCVFYYAPTKHGLWISCVYMNKKTLRLFLYEKAWLEAWSSESHTCRNSCQCLTIMYNAIKLAFFSHLRVFFFILYQFSPLYLLDEKWTGSVVEWLQLLPAVDRRTPSSLFMFMVSVHVLYCPESKPPPLFDP